MSPAPLAAYVALRQKMLLQQLAILRSQIAMVEEERRLLMTIASAAAGEPPVPPSAKLEIVR